MGKSANNMSVALFGGTFNPIHFGHLNLASELADYLQVESVRMLPCAIPAHRETPNISAEQRLAMLELAIDGNPSLVADDLELKRGDTSFSIDTVGSIRQAIGLQTPLFFCIGMDALLSIHSWHRWTELLDYCHIVACSRPDYELPSNGVVAKWIDQHLCNDLTQVKKQSHGCLHLCKIPLLDISSTAIRDNIKYEKNIDHMTSESVVNYIKQHSLYE
jgi:nicotinate-nucleotide adenylyltransferase